MEIPYVDGVDPLDALFESWDETMDLSVPCGKTRKLSRDELSLYWDQRPGGEEPNEFDRRIGALHQCQKYKIQLWRKEYGLLVYNMRKNKKKSWSDEENEMIRTEWFKHIGSSNKFDIRMALCLHRSVHALAKQRCALRLV